MVDHVTPKIETKLENYLVVKKLAYKGDTYSIFSNGLHHMFFLQIMTWACRKGKLDLYTNISRFIDHLSDTHFKGVTMLVTSFDNFVFYEIKNFDDETREFYFYRTYCMIWVYKAVLGGNAEILSNVCKLFIPADIWMNIDEVKDFYGDRLLGSDNEEENSEIIEGIYDNLEYDTEVLWDNVSINYHRIKQIYHQDDVEKIRDVLVSFLNVPPLILYRDDIIQRCQCRTSDIKEITDDFSDSISYYCIINGNMPLLKQLLLNHEQEIANIVDDAILLCKSKSKECVLMLYNILSPKKRKAIRKQLGNAYIKIKYPEMVDFIQSLGD